MSCICNTSFGYTVKLAPQSFHTGPGHTGSGPAQADRQAARALNGTELRRNGTEQSPGMFGTNETEHRSDRNQG
jgi:hypothetical protein